MEPTEVAAGRFCPLSSPQMLHDSAQDPDFWNAHFMQLMQQGMLNICLTEESCQAVRT